MATGPLLERSEQLARIESALSEARFGKGMLLVIEGPAGIGKTALLDAARAAAAVDRLHVVDRLDRHIRHRPPPSSRRSFGRFNSATHRN